MADGALSRLGRWCFLRRWRVLLVWLVVVAAGGLASGPVFAGLADNNNPHGVESIDGLDALDAGADTGGTVVGLVDRVDPRDAAVRTAVAGAAGDLATITDVKRVLPATPAADGGELLVSAVLRKVDRRQRNAAVDAISTRLHRLAGELRAAGQARARVRVGGQPVLNRQANQTSQQDISLAEVVSLPITLVVLVVVFGGLAAAGLPVLAAVASVATAMLFLLGFSRITDLDANAPTVVSLLGLGLSIDYGLLLVARYREELAGGFDPATAVGRAWATAGRTIMFSALTVAAALSGLLMFDVPGLSALGVAGLSIAVVAMVVALTCTAALLGMVRRWIRPSTRAMRRRAHYGDAAEIGAFARLSRLVQRFPAPVAVAAAALLLAAAAPLLTGTVKLPRLTALPSDLESVQVAHELGSRFGQPQTPASRWWRGPTRRRSTPGPAAGTATRR